jgi:hypothetical protein
MRRELASKMYSPTTYYLGRFLSNLIIQLIYPFLMATILFFGIGIDISLYSYLHLMAFAFLGNMVFCSQGYAVGALVKGSDAAKIVNFLIVMFMVGTNGTLTNTSTGDNVIVKALSKISPSRFHCEAFFRVLTKQVDDH